MSWFNCLWDAAIVVMGAVSVLDVLEGHARTASKDALLFTFPLWAPLLAFLNFVERGDELIDVAAHAAFFAAFFAAIVFTFGVYARRILRGCPEGRMREPFFGSDPSDNDTSFR